MRKRDWYIWCLTMLGFDEDSDVVKTANCFRLVGRKLSFTTTITLPNYIRLR